MGGSHLVVSEQVQMGCILTLEGFHKKLDDYYNTIWTIHVPEKPRIPQFCVRDILHSSQT